MKLVQLLLTLVAGLILASYIPSSNGLPNVDFKKIDWKNIGPETLGKLKSMGEKGKAFFQEHKEEIKKSLANTKDPLGVAQKAEELKPTKRDADDEDDVDKRALNGVDWNQMKGKVSKYLQGHHAGAAAKYMKEHPDVMKSIASKMNIKPTERDADDEDDEDDVDKRALNGVDWSQIRGKSSKFLQGHHAGAFSKYMKENPDVMKSVAAKMNIKPTKRDADDEDDEDDVDKRALNGVDWSQMKGKVSKYLQGHHAGAAAKYMKEHPDVMKSVAAKMNIKPTKRDADDEDNEDDVDKRALNGVDWSQIRGKSSKFLQGHHAGAFSKYMKENPEVMKTIAAKTNLIPTKRETDNDDDED